MTPRLTRLIPRVTSRTTTHRTARRGPVAEVRAFLAAALLDPVPRDHSESDQAFRRRRVVAAVTLAAGGLLLALALRIPPGENAFYWATAALAAVWSGGAVLSGPLHLGHARTRAGRADARPWVQSLALGGLLIGVFLVGAIVVAHLPPVRDQVDAVLDHARFGSLPLILLIVVVNGIAEELYFRGALFAAVGRRHAVLVTTIVYALTTAGTGNPMLVLAAALLGLLTGLQRRVTGGVLGPILTHILWSSTMLLLLPPILEALR
ncbi:MAG: CPBP family intramembrane metalloprotease [Tetrasphaera sp.]|jgi:membrane protease YdiL (CAAX protease family)|nr:CPBP family intramembrane metalloprotease [Tetrasphaera sp.]